MPNVAPVFLANSPLLVTLVVVGCDGGIIVASACMFVLFGMHTNLFLLLILARAISAYLCLPCLTHSFASLKLI